MISFLTSVLYSGFFEVPRCQVQASTEWKSDIKFWSDAKSQAYNSFIIWIMGQSQEGKYFSAVIQTVSGLIHFMVAKQVLITVLKEMEAN